MSVYYNRNLEKEKKDLEKEMRKDKWQEALIAVSERLPLGKVQTQGHAFSVDRQAILGGSAPRESYSGTLAHFLGKTLEGTLSSGEARVSHPMMGPRASHPGSCNHCKSRGAPGYTYYGKVSILTLHAGASMSAVPFSPRPRPSKKITVWGISGQPLEHHFTQPLVCFWGDFHFCHSFLIVPETPTLLLG
jgi:hypothetical protein